MVKKLAIQSVLTLCCDLSFRKQFLTLIFNSQYEITYLWKALNALHTLTFKLKRNVQLLTRRELLQLSEVAPFVLPRKQLRRQYYTAKGPAENPNIYKR